MINTKIFTQNKKQGMKIQESIHYNGTTKKNMKESNQRTYQRDSFSSLIKKEKKKKEGFVVYSGIVTVAFALAPIPPCLLVNSVPVFKALLCSSLSLLGFSFLAF